MSNLVEVSEELLDEELARVLADSTLLVAPGPVLFELLFTTVLTALLPHVRLLMEGLTDGVGPLLGHLPTRTNLTDDLGQVAISSQSPLMERLLVVTQLPSLVARDHVVLKMLGSSGLGIFEQSGVDAVASRGAAVGHVSDTFDFSLLGLDDAAFMLLLVLHLGLVELLLRLVPAMLLGPAAWFGRFTSLLDVVGLAEGFSPDVHVSHVVVQTFEDFTFSALRLWCSGEGLPHLVPSLDNGLCTLE